MHPYTALLVLAAAFSSASFAQSTAPSDPAGSGPTPERQADAARSGDVIVDCPEDMANARQARQAGHITDKEYAEQRKMAETKLRRDARQAGGAEKNIECK